jgi:hypothetical protein
MDNKKKVQIRWVSVRVVERFINVLYPIDIPMLLRVLPNIGYIVPRKGLKGVLEPGDALAQKGNCELVMDQHNKLLGIESRDIPEAIQGFSELRNLWLKELNPSPAAETHYLELTGEGVIKTDINPTDAFNDYWSKNAKFGEINKIVGFDTTNYGIRIVPSSTNPNGVRWFDLRIQPTVISSANEYYINIVWRDGNVDALLKEYERLEQLIENIIGVIQ